MRVFVTGASGYIGRAVVPELLAHGHSVLGLARSDANADILTKLGADVHRADLTDTESLKAGAATCDGVIHLAFIHDFSNMANSVAVDLAAIAAMADAIEGTGKPLIISGGTLSLQSGVLATEDSEDEQCNNIGKRAAANHLIRRLTAEKGIRGQVIRLAPTVHDVGDHGLLPHIIDICRKNGSVTIIGTGSSRWSAVHRKDAAVLYRLALEKGKAGATYHGVCEQELSTSDVGDVIAKEMNLPVERKSVEEAAQSLRFLAHMLAADVPCSSEKTRKELGWEPKEIGLFADLKKNYFGSVAGQL